MSTGDTLDLTQLDFVLKKTVQTVEASQEQIFDIAENARMESQLLKTELEQVKKETAWTIDQTDLLERNFRLSRQRLVDVSGNFQRFTEKDIKKAYEVASEIQIELSLCREKEMALRTRRNELERRLKGLANTIEKAENLMTQISVVLGYLTGDLGNLSTAMETAQQKQRLAIQVIQAQEEERKRVARDIHDGPAQSMAHVVVRSEIAERMLTQGRYEEVKKELAELKETVRQTLGEVRKIIFDLRPMALDDLGLLPTLRKYLEGFEQRSEIRAELIHHGEERRLSATIEVVIFRLVQEALNNAAKHAQAKNVQVKLEFGLNQIKGVVKDDGTGFEYLEQTEQPQFGIMGMKERMKLLEGNLDIDSAKGKGTRIVFTIPIDK